MHSMIVSSTANGFCWQRARTRYVCWSLRVRPLQDPSPGWGSLECYLHGVVHMVCSGRSADVKISVGQCMPLS